MVGFIAVSECFLHYPSCTRCTTRCTMTLSVLIMKKRCKNSRKLIFIYEKRALIYYQIAFIL
jgi:hypothetical protein